MGKNEKTKPMPMPEENFYCLEVPVNWTFYFLEGPSNPQYGSKILFVTSIFPPSLQAKKRLLTLIKRPRLLNVHAY